MEVVINNKKFNLENKIIGLVMNEPIIKDEHSLVIKDYYNEVTLGDSKELKMASLLGNNNSNSFTNNKRKSLVKLFNNKCNYYILEEFNLGFTYIDNNGFLKFFRNMSNKYHKCIILKSHDMNYLVSNCDYLIDYSQGLVFSKDEYYKIQFENKPEILKFTELCLSNGMNIKYYYNRLDLLKMLYKVVK